jgi:undecaprenyl diphosphate synthase
MTFYGFTGDNVKRPSVQVKAIQNACVNAVDGLADRDADLLVVGNTESPVFPKVCYHIPKELDLGMGL